jgi:hypothetical protein
MDDIETLVKGEVVFIEDKKNGEPFFFTGMVSLIDLERKEVGIKRVLKPKDGMIRVDEDTRPFPIQKIWRIEDLVNHLKKQNGEQNNIPHRPPTQDNNHLTRVMAGFFLTVAKGETNPESIKEFAQGLVEKRIIREDGAIRAQDAISALSFAHP